MTRNRAWRFFVAAYIWSWVWWVPMALTLRSRDIVDLGEAPWWVFLCFAMGGYGPSLAGLFMASRDRQRGARELLSRLKRWRAPVVVHLVLWLGPSAFLVIAMVARPAEAQLLGDPVWSRLSLVPIALLAAIPFGPLGEELGWRGYALPHLQRRHSALASSLIIGVAWCFWHTPLFWAPAGTTISGEAVTPAAIGLYLAYTCGLSIVYTWIYNSSRGSVLLAVLFHASGNAVLPFVLFPDRDGDAALAIEWWALVPLWATALALIAIYGGGRLARGRRVVARSVVEHDG
ncbi:MAG: CPBP family intramembrane glutamic endopeptidase [Gemmatimonadota bacterium]|nr:CPBP family intramembrane glutamic endopeptidase [Gemmatimonadota bacterium]